MRVLVACEFSGRVREAFREKGHDAWSCDLRETEIPGQHIQGDVFSIINAGWDMMIAHPPCTYLSYCGARWFNRQPDRVMKRDNALYFFAQLLNADIKYICIENPRGWSKWVATPTQEIQPYEYGCPRTKATWLWLKNLPDLQPTNVLTEYSINWMKWGSKGDVLERERTIPQIALAMAAQWGMS